MFQTEKREIANSRADYAAPADLCKVLEGDMKSFYLLAFLLTANHKDAERCFVSTADAAFEGQAVFKEWVRPWIKRILINNAIQIAAPASGQDPGKRDLWSAGQQGTPGGDEINAVTRLAPLERFILVMSALEHYSAWECSLLLGCDMKKVVRVRVQALRGLAGGQAILPRAETMFSHTLPVPA